MANESSENVSRAVSLLREAAAVLAQNTASLSSHETPESTTEIPTPTTATSISNNINNVASTTNARSSSRNNSGPSGESTSTALRNFRLLFAPYGRTSRETTHRPPPKKVCRRDGKRKATETWTHEVFCLASIDEQATPTRVRKENLQRAGLGRRKIKFDANSTAVQFKEKLEEIFPKLITGGGFDLLRRGPSGNELVTIRQPPSGYTVKYLRETTGLGQALLYIRPLQLNLDISPQDANDTDYDSEVRQN